LISVMTIVSLFVSQCTNIHRTSALCISLSLKGREELILPPMRSIKVNLFEDASFILDSVVLSIV